jgi:L-iditol 2-dehydrogenase
MMSAVVFEGQEEMRLARIARPVCGEGSALLRVAACGICGSDARSYFQGDQFTGASRIPGHEVAGTIEETGSGVRICQPGERVALAADVHCGNCWYCRRGIFNMCTNLRILGKHLDGGLAEFMLLTPDILRNGIINRVPQAVTLRQAAISEPLCSVLASHDELTIQAGEFVVVIGCGPMGILHLELLRLRQARVAVVDLSPHRLTLASREFGAEWALDARRSDLAEAIFDVTDGLGADVVIVAAPSAAAVAGAVGLVRKRGRIGIFGGLPSGSAEVCLDVNRIHYDELRLVGNFSYHPRYHIEALKLLASGGVRADKLTTFYPIEETCQGLHDIRDGKVLKAVVIPDQGAAE